jgi:PAS domain S-box-containing protein
VVPGEISIVSLASDAAKLDTPRMLLFYFVIFFFTISPVGALDTSRQITQYGHTAWRVEDGVFAGSPNVIAQTTDGYLWIGTQAGLTRFDGVRFVSWRPPEGKELPSSRIISLLGARDRSLWIGTAMGLARWRNGELTKFRAPAGSIMAILEDHDGTIWIARANISDTQGPLCKVTDAGLRCYGRDDGVAVPYAVALANDSLGNVWLAGGPTVSRWQPGSSGTYVSPGLDPAEIFNGVLALAGRPDGPLWVGLVHDGKGGGLQQLAQGAWKPFVTPEFDGSTLEVTALLLDRDSSLWVGTLNQGIYRIQGNKVDHFRSSDGLSGDAVTRLFQDHEGNIWIATSSGIDNLHDLRVASFSTRQGLSADQVNSVLASRDGTVWIGNYNLDVLRSGKITSIQPRNRLPGRAMTSLLEDRAGRLWVGVDEDLWVYERGNFRKIPTRDGSPLGAVRALAEDVDGSVWAATNIHAGNRNRLLRIQDLRIPEEISSPQLPPINALAPDPHGGVWLGLASGGLARVRNGQMEFFPFSSPHDGPVYGLLVNSDASILAATRSGLVGRRNGTLQTLTMRNGLPCDVIYSLISDSKATLWLYAACGVIAIPNAELQRWWESPNATVKSRLFDVFDGARPMSTPFQPNASQSPDGRLWFANENVLQMIDPAHLDSNPISPPVHVEEIIADHKNYAPRDGLRLPALTRNLEIDYTALSFVAPQKVRFRYKLEGHDSEWQDPGTRRQAFYADLRPGNYRFRVMACNNDGVWNEEGATLAFSVAAAWYQTWWFRGASLAVFLALLWALYQWRIQQVKRQEKQLRDVIDTIPALAFSSSPDGKNEWVNRRWVEYSGLSQESSSGSGWRSTVHPDDLDEHVKKWQRSLASGEPFENEARRRSANDEYRWFLVRAVPLRDAHGNILKWYGTLTDIEDRKKAEQERERLRRLQADLAHVNRVSMMGELTASLSHELKQPIAAAITNANTCLRWLKRDQPDVEEAREATMRIVKDGNRAAEIINRLRSFYKKDSPPERELVDVNDVVGEMLVLLHSEANQNSVSMCTELSSDLPKVRADRVQLQQVCLNLMLNAIEAMKDTGGELTIRSGRTDDGELLISVSDTGMGLPAEQANQIFGAFFTTKPDGSGMGLTISRSIIESHGGRLWAGANAERGATFYFTLPSESMHSRLTA